jgi:fructose-1,6-bisphosphatase/inositol monophosphatase family enzyme
LTTRRAVDVEAVADLLREVGAAVVDPRFEALTEGDVRHKGPGDVVTVADEEAERAIAAGLRAMPPGVPIVGDEATAADPSLLGALDAPQAWVVDPIDGTANFVAGSPDWAMMVALLADGEAVASWIWQPRHGRLFVAERGAGAAVDGQPLVSPPRPTIESELRGAVLTRYLDGPTSAAVERNRRRFGEVGDGRLCAGVEYPALVEGDVDFILFWRTLPWDHAPGVLLLTEAGGVARRPDGSPYRPADDAVGLLLAGDGPTWDTVAEGLLARPPLDGSSARSRRR